jgi:uncharacterized YigZ family protein
LHREEWITLAQQSHISIEEKKSVFIADAAPISSARDAEDFLCGIKKKYPDARHHVYAWRVGGDEILQRYSDDGEPAGTAGIPVLDVMRRNQIDDAIVVVTRYFGGVLLGTGGLSRAYAKAAALALSGAGPSFFSMCELHHITIAYSQLDRLRFVLKKADFHTEEPLYGEEPVLPVFCKIGHKDDLTRICLDATAGRAVITYIDTQTVRTGRMGEMNIESEE